MPAIIEEMFYTGGVHSHGLGIQVAKPANVDEALKLGGLNWDISEMNLMTPDDPPSSVLIRRAIVRMDRKPSDECGVLGVAHRGFRPIQNHEGAMWFDSIFSNGRAAYHTGGCLGNGETVWLLAKINKTIQVANEDFVESCAIMANSHHGSMVSQIRLITVRVVCYESIACTLKYKKCGHQFHRAHQGALREHAEAAKDFFKASLAELDYVAESFTSLSKLECVENSFKEILTAPLPEKKKRRHIELNTGLKKVSEQRVADTLTNRTNIGFLRSSGKGMGLPGSAGTYRGVLNAVLEFMGHHQRVEGSRLSYALLSDGMDLKVKAFALIQDCAAKAA